MEDMRLSLWTAEGPNEGGTKMGGGRGGRGGREGVARGRVRSRKAADTGFSLQHSKAK